MKKLNDIEKALFVAIGLPGVKGKEGLKGKVIYDVKNGRLRDVDLSETFEDEYLKMLDAVQKKGFFFDRTNYVFEYFFRVHNSERECRVLPAQVVGFKAERRGDCNILSTRVRYYNGEMRDEKLELSPFMLMSDLNLNDFVLVHNKEICKKITEGEFKEIIQKYF
ncbi:MAG: hypothetical protein QXO69_03330 [archaeon]